MKNLALLAVLFSFIFSFNSAKAQDKKEEDVNVKTALSGFKFKVLAQHLCREESLILPLIQKIKTLGTSPLVLEEYGKQQMPERLGIR